MQAKNIIIGGEYAVDVVHKRQDGTSGTYRVLGKVRARITRTDHSHTENSYEVQYKIPGSDTTYVGTAPAKEFQMEAEAYKLVREQRAKIDADNKAAEEIRKALQHKCTRLIGKVLGIEAITEARYDRSLNKPEVRANARDVELNEQAIPLMIEYLEAHGVTDAPTE